MTRPSTAQPSTAQPTEAAQIEAVRALARASRSLERASGELSLAHYRVLAAVAAGEERASRVAARLALGKPTISAAVDALSQRGLIERLAVTGDQRASALVLTEAGKDTLARVEAAMVAKLSAMTGEAGDEARIVDALVALGRGIDATLGRRTT